MNITIDASAITRLNEAWKRAPEMVIEELTAATYEAEMLLEREIKDLTPTGVGAAGGLRGSIQSQMPEVLSNTVIGMVGSTLTYAEAVELGTKPHPVGSDGIRSIYDWVQHKLGISEDEAQSIAYAIAWKIRMKGTPGKFMFTKTLAAQRAQLAELHQAAAGRIVNRLGGVT